MFLITKAQEARIRRQERARAQKILHEFALKAEKIHGKRFREAAKRFIKLGFCEGFSIGTADPGLSREGFYTKAMAFANEKVDSILGKKCK